MIIIESVISLFLLLTFFFIMGLGTVKAKTALKNFPLVALFGYAALIGLSYIISANFRVTGETAVGYSILILSMSFLIRIKSFSHLITDATKNDELKMVFAVIAIPICTLLFPSLIAGFKYFFAFINYDFFYNSQDSVFLQNHNVIQFNKSNETITPLIWSAGYSGRIAVGLLGSFFPKWINLNSLQFNSLLINTIVILFTLALSVFCQEVFHLKKKSTLIAIFFSIMSAAYVQSYCYYVLGQLSALPIFVVYCILLKRFLDTANEKNKLLDLNNDLIGLALILNILFIMYAILCIFAIALTISSYALHFRNKSHKNAFNSLIKALCLTGLLFFVIRLFIMPESIHTIKSWVTLSNRVATGSKHTNDFLVFSEYLTESFPALLIGLANYPSFNSIFHKIIYAEESRLLLLMIIGLISILTTLLVLKTFAKSEKPNSSKAIIISLFFIILATCALFFIYSASYGLFKIQTWFIPILMPLYIYFLTTKFDSKKYYILKSLCVFILFFNLISSFLYLSDFFVKDTRQRFINVHGVNANNNIIDITDKFKSLHVKNASLFLTNGMEVAWISDLLRKIHFLKVSHNTQPLIEKDLVDNPCSNFIDAKWRPSDMMIVNNPKQAISDITSPPDGGRVVYKNNSYTILDPAKLKTLIYLGSGSYPIENYPTNNDEIFPKKFRWIEKGVEIYIYSDRDRVEDLKIEITPGYVSTKNSERNLTLITQSKTYKFSIAKKTMLTANDVKLHSGLNCMLLESPDIISHNKRKNGLIRPNIPLDARLTNFAISYVGLAN